MLDYTLVNPNNKEPSCAESPSPYSPSCCCPRSVRRKPRPRVTTVITIVTTTITTIMFTRKEMPPEHVNSESYKLGFAAGQARTARENPYIEAEGFYDFSNWELGFDDGLLAVRKTLTLRRDDCTPSSSNPEVL